MTWTDRLCILVVSIPDYRCRGSESDCRHCQIFWEAVSMERDSLSLVGVSEKLLGEAVSIQRIEINSRRDPLHWPRNTLYSQKSALASPVEALGRFV
jgi:hypothetical protein